MSRMFDVIVLGLGGMGSSAAYHLAGRGKKVLGIEQFSPNHDKGSSHGKTRIIRQSYYEDPAYVPLLLRAYELWRQLEKESGVDLLYEVGGLMIGTESSSVVSGSVKSAKTHNLSHEILNAKEIRRRFPVFTPSSETIALYERRAGFVMSEKCVLAHLDQAARRGAELKFNERISNWQAEQGSRKVIVETAMGTYEAEHLVITPGAWAPESLAELHLPLNVERQVLYWFESSQGVVPFLTKHFPIFIWKTEEGLHPYGFPAIDGVKGGVKVALHRPPFSSQCTPGTIDRLVSDDEVNLMRNTITSLIPSLDGPCVRAVTCLYTSTPDRNFVLAEHPRHKQVVIACGFSGHGFKFASVVGEVLADLVTRGSTVLDIDFMRPQRFITI